MKSINSKRPWDINEFTGRVRQLNEKWWQDPHTGLPVERNPFELLALVVSELSECLEGERKNLMDDHLPHRRMAEVEMADAYIRLADYAGGFGFRLQLEMWWEWEVPENKGEAIFAIATSLRANVLGISEAMIAVECYCKKHNYDLFGAIEEKLAYNAVRKDHTLEARRAEGGKKF